MIMYKKLRIKSITLLLCLSTIGISFPLPVHASESNTNTLKTITLNPTALRPTDGKWSKDTGNLLYFGTYVTGYDSENNQAPINGPLAYRVLASSPDTQTTTTECLLLDSDKGLVTPETEMAFSQNQENNNWTDSEPCKWLNTADDFRNNFSNLENNAIANTLLLATKEYQNDLQSASTWQFEDSESSNNIFLLSAKEIQTLYADCYSINKQLSFNSSSDDVGPGWWLRSATTSRSFGSSRPDNAALVPLGGGTIHTSYILNNTGKNLCPAFNVNTNSIAFVSDVNTPKTSTALAPVEPTNSRNWKATLIDESKTISIPERFSVTQEEVDGVTTVTVPFRYSGDDITQISVMITNKAYTESDAQVLYYGALKNVDLEQARINGGRGTFTLPDGLTKNSKVYILAEDINGATETDYTSVPCEIPVTIVEPDDGSDTDSNPDDNPDTNTNPDKNPDTDPNPDGNPNPDKNPDTDSIPDGNSNPDQTPNQDSGENPKNPSDSEASGTKPNNPSMNPEASGTKPNVPSDSTNASSGSPNTSETSNNNKNTVQTGDNTNIVYLSLLMVISGIFVILTVINKKKRI